MLDQYKNKIRKSLEPVFEKSRRVRAWRNKACGFLQGLGEINRHHPVDIDVDIIEADRLLRLVLDKIEADLPHAVCTACQGHDPLCVCNGRGWLSKSQMFRCPKASKRKQDTSELDISQTAQETAASSE